MQELITKQAKQECGFCKERDNRLIRYEDEIEKEKIVHCQMALEREKIAKGMQCSRKDEIRLKEMQKMQMQEKKIIEEQEEGVERMWHQILLDTVKMKEEYERQEAERTKRETLERRLFYDEQIASANKKRREAIRHEREIENKRLDRMKKKMEEDCYEALKRKKDQQERNRINFIDGHEMKMSRIRNEKKNDRELDNETIRNAVEELRKERQKMKREIQTLRIDERIFVDNVNRERKMAEKLSQETDKIIAEWNQKGFSETEEKNKCTELLKFERKKSAAEEYRKHIEERRQEIERGRYERYEKMQQVKNTALAEVRRNLDNANEELKRQIQYRNTLTNQIRENQRIMEAELNSIECKQRPFTKKAIMFKEAMDGKINNSRVSTNPVHPFRRIMQSQTSADSKIILPSIEKY